MVLESESYGVEVREFWSCESESYGVRVRELWSWSLRFMELESKS